jgi:hypothetical protein
MCSHAQAFQSIATTFSKLSVPSLMRITGNIAPALLPDLLEAVSPYQSVMKMAASGLLDFFLRATDQPPVQASVMRLLERCQAQNIPIDYLIASSFLEKELASVAPLADNKVAFILWLRLLLVQRGVVPTPPYEVLLGSALLRRSHTATEYVFNGVPVSTNTCINAWIAHYANSADRRFLSWSIDRALRDSVTIPDDFLLRAASEVAKLRWILGVEAAELTPVIQLTMPATQLSVPHAGAVGFNLLERVSVSERRALLASHSELVPVIATAIEADGGSHFMDDVRSVALRLGFRLLLLLANREDKRRLAETLHPFFSKFGSLKLEDGFNFATLFSTLRDLSLNPPAPWLVDDFASVFFKDILAVIPESAPKTVEPIAAYLGDVVDMLAIDTPLRVYMSNRVPTLLAAVGCGHACLCKQAIRVREARAIPPLRMISCARNPRFRRWSTS